VIKNCGQQAVLPVEVIVKLYIHQSQTTLIIKEE